MFICIAIIVIWNVLGFISLFLIPYLRDSASLGEMFNPVDIYNNLKVNWFGCIILTILFNILCPIMSIGYWTVLFVTWLCTVGRT